jgi:hypothetical protein
VCSYEEEYKENFIKKESENKRIKNKSNSNLEDIDEDKVNFSSMLNPEGTPKRFASEFNLFNLSGNKDESSSHISYNDISSVSKISHINKDSNNILNLNLNNNNPNLNSQIDLQSFDTFDNNKKHIKLNSLISFDMPVEDHSPNSSRIHPLNNSNSIRFNISTPKNAEKVRNIKKLPEKLKENIELEKSKNSYKDLIIQSEKVLKFEKNESDSLFDKVLNQITEKNKQKRRPTRDSEESCKNVKYLNTDNNVSYNFKKEELNRNSNNTSSSKAYSNHSNPNISQIHKENNFLHNVPSSFKKENKLAINCNSNYSSNNQELSLTIKNNPITSTPRFSKDNTVMDKGKSNEKEFKEKEIYTNKFEFDDSIYYNFNLLDKNCKKGKDFLTMGESQLSRERESEGSTRNDGNNNVRRSVLHKNKNSSNKKMNYFTLGGFKNPNNE